jgi:hypothetical protein
MKFVNEDIEDILKGKSDEEIEEIIRTTGNIPPDYLAGIINSEKGEYFKANWTGVWDKFGPIKEAITTEINRGSGFEKAILVSCDPGTFIYMGPFKLEGRPTKDMMLLFKAGDGIYVNNVIFKKI